MKNMKLYPEEKVICLLNKHLSEYEIDRLLSNIEPIELPSDEEIEEKLNSFNDDYLRGLYNIINEIEEKTKQQDK